MLFRELNVNSKSLRRAVGSAIGAWALVVATITNASVSDLQTDDIISPWCRIGSLQSWQGRPCIISEQSRPGWSNVD